MTPRTRSWLAAAATSAALVLVACPRVRVPQLYGPGSLAAAHTSEPLKVHLRSGHLLVLDTWSDLPGDSGLRGAGTRYDVRRRVIGPFAGRIARDSIALLETTAITTALPVGSFLLGTYTVLAGAATAVCLANPKSCFGSCPTFYLDGDQERPVAEGFSASVARVLEATDVDYLGDIHPAGRTFALTMRNEALETHAVRSVRLLVAPRPARGSVVATGDGRFFDAGVPLAPLRCTSSAGDCRDAVARRDGREWWTRADSSDLGAEDSLDLLFPAAPRPAALLVTARQSLLSTYVFYQSLAYAGSRGGDLLAAVETAGPSALPGPWQMMRRLARAEVLIRSAGGAWSPAGAYEEPGPIAADEGVVPLPDVDGGPVQVRLRFARGAWRFDRLALVTLGAAVKPAALEPARVESDGRPDTVALARLIDRERYLITYPGESYRIVFSLPRDGRELEFFLETTGYYYEWMRSEWLREEDPAMLELIARDPVAALGRMAPGYARLEPQFERLFWSSRFGRR
jgi:hypothetical protein